MRERARETLHPHEHGSYAGKASVMGGGHRDVAHDAAHYEGYPKGVWSPTGGWWSDNKYWRRNTALALAGIFLVCIPIAMTSARLEVIFCLFPYHVVQCLGFWG